MQNKILESLMRMEENAISPVKVAEDKVNIYSSLYESLINSVNRVKTNNCKSNLDITGLYEKALQEGIHNVYPNNHWTDITKCNIRQTLLENKNDVKATINRIVKESIDNYFCDEYIDTEGMFTGKAGGHIHIDELKAIYDEDKDWDPVIGQSASFEDWMNDTIESGYLVAITDDVDEDDFELKEDLKDFIGKSCIFVDELDRMPRRLSSVLMKELLKGTVIAVAHSTNNIDPAILDKFSIYEMDPDYSIFEDIILRTIAICDNVLFICPPGLGAVDLIERIAKKHKITLHHMDISSNPNTDVGGAVAPYVEESIKESRDGQIRLDDKVKIKISRGTKNAVRPDEVDRLMSLNGKVGIVDNFVWHKLPSGKGCRLYTVKLPNGEKWDLVAGDLTVVSNESLKEDTIKQGSQWVNKGEEGTHGKFKTKKAADAQRKAMFANGYKAESIKPNKSVKVYTSSEHTSAGSPSVPYGYMTINHPTLGKFEVSYKFTRPYEIRFDGYPWGALIDPNERQIQFVREHEKELKKIIRDDVPVTELPVDIDDDDLEPIEEDVVKKSDGKWVNRSDKGVEHGEFSTKKAANEQRRAMFANMDDEETKEVAYHKEFTKDGKKVSVELWKDDDEFSIEVNKKYGDKIPSDLKKEVKDTVGKKTFDTEKEGKAAVDKAVDSVREKTESCNKKELKEEDDEAALQALRSGATLRDALAESHVDISEKEGTIANILKKSMQEWGNAKTRDEAVNAINNAFKDANMTPATKRFLYEINKKRALNDVITTATNYYLSGANLSMRRGTAAYDRGENYAKWREKSSK